MNQIVEPVVFWGALLAGLVVYALVGWQLMRAVRRGKPGRFVAVIAYGAATPFMAMVPVFIAYAARWVATLAGFPVFPKGSADDGVMVGIGIFGIIMAMGAAVLFALVMIFQAVTGSGDSDSDAKD